MYLKKRFYWLMTLVILLTAAGAAVPVLFAAGRFMLFLLAVALLADVALLWSRRQAITATRHMADRFSNGDENRVSIRLESCYPFAVKTVTIDEIPFVFQRRDVCFRAPVRRTGEATIVYHLTPTKRGVYGFGHVRVFVSTQLGLVERRFTLCEPQDVKVYPSYLMLRQYELLAMSNNLTEMGIKRIRRVGNNTDFEQTKDYVDGDDYRTINWKATARRSVGLPRLMVNVYQEERSQQVFCVIDKGRMMQQTFAVAPVGNRQLKTDSPMMTLLDYAINASLVLSFVAVNRQDKAGLITFSDTMDTFVPASNQTGHMQTVLEALYAEQTHFEETDFSALLVGLARHVARRSLLVLFTSFTSMAALSRQLPFLRQLASRHRLLVVFFEDEELLDYTRTAPRTTEQYYQHTIAQKFLYEQRLVAQTLRQYGIQTLLTTPASLSVGVVNKYLAIRNR